MGIEREFLGWERTPLESGVAWLVARAKRLGPSLDLTAFAVCLPSARAGRVLLNLLLHEAERGGGVLLPPTVLTPGTLKRALLEAAQVPARKPVAGPLVRRLAWRAALDELPVELRQAIGGGKEADEAEPLVIASLVERSHARLVSLLQTFAGAWKAGAGVHGGSLEPRLAGLAEAEVAYERVLLRAGVSDPELWLARAVDGAIRLQRLAFRQMALIGVADMPPSLGVLLRRAGEELEVSALVCAPEERAASFDDLGGLVVGAWLDGEIDLGAGRLRVVDSAVELVHATLEVVGDLPKGTTTDDVVLGVTDRAIEAPLVRAARECGVRVRPAGGRDASRLPVGLLLAQVRTLLTEPTFRSWGTLLRHPWFHAAVECEVALNRLDRYVLEHLPDRLGEELVQDADAEMLGGMLACTRTLLGNLSPLVDGRAGGERRTLSSWAKEIGDLVERAAPRGEREPPAGVDEETGLEAVFAAIGQMEELARLGDLDRVVTAESAMSVLLTLLEEVEAPPEEVEGAVEAVGWLELATDPARHVVVVGMNDGMVPSREVPDPLLPLPVLRAMGVDAGDARVARDAYLLSLLGASRRSLSIVVSRRGVDGDPLLPSRLLFRVGDETMIARARHWVPQRGAAKVVVPVPPARAVAALSKFRPLMVAQKGFPERWRVTAFKDYLASPYLFYLRHVAQVQEVEEATVEMLPHRFGSLVHDVLRDFARSDTSDSASEADIRASVHGSLERRVAMLFGESPPVPVWLQARQALSRLDGFARWQATRSREGWSILQSEWSPGKDGVGFAWSGGSVRLTGRIDRIDQHPTLGIALIDYKTADTAMKPEKTHRSKGAWTDLQLPLYRHLAKSVLDGTGAEGGLALAYLNLAADGEAKFEGADWDGAELLDADEAARAVIARVYAGEFGEAGTIPPTSKTFGALAGLGHLGEMDEEDEDEA